MEACAPGLVVGPRSIERPADAGSTLVAGLDGVAPARVDGGGLVTPYQAHWSLDWWIGAEDRWHVPAREPSVRQRRIGHGPVIETALRVPSGDVISTVYPVVVGGATATVIEISNQSPVPVALAVALRPYTVDGVGADLGPVELDGRTVVIGGVPVMRLPRPPNEAGVAAGVDLLATVEAGGSLDWAAAPSGPTINAACLYPLPHQTSLRFVLPAGPPGELGSLDGLPDAAAAARGWTTVIDRASRWELPDDGISALAGAARARLVLGSAELVTAVVALEPGSGRQLEALAAGGHRHECRLVLDALAAAFPARLESSPTDGADVVVGAARAAALVGADGLAEALLEPLAQLTLLVERGADASPDAAARAKSALADVVELAGQPGPAAELRHGLDHALISPRSSLARVSALAERAAPARRWSERVDGTDVDSAGAAARFWLETRSLLIAERRLNDGGILVELMPEFPTAWLGGAVEVHEAPISGVVVSFAVRWHGYRPALLWEVDGPQTTAVTLTCPGLDPEWRGEARRGEALLAGVPESLPDAPGPGDSFA